MVMFLVFTKVCKYIVALQGFETDLSCNSGWHLSLLQDLEFLSVIKENG